MSFLFGFLAGAAYVKTSKKCQEDFDNNMRLAVKVAMKGPDYESPLYKILQHNNQYTANKQIPKKEV